MWTIVKDGCISISSRHTARVIYEQELFSASSTSNSLKFSD